jgi:hypothetical protein
MEVNGELGDRQRVIEELSGWFTAPDARSTAVTKNPIPQRTKRIDERSRTGAHTANAAV